jgi:ubiquinone/menaquinone biosynthesis C-methylase UbiE
MSPGYDDRADQWLAWARKPDFDAYWRYRDHFFGRIVPAPGRATLEIGCGEGRVARDLGRRGHTVTAVDASAVLVASAAEADPAGRYLVASAEDLPFDTDDFDLVVAYNSLMDVDDMPAVVAEAVASWGQAAGLRSASPTHFSMPGGLPDLLKTRPSSSRAPTSARGGSTTY